jgi:hypothetical protein
MPCIAEVDRSPAPSGTGDSDGCPRSGRRDPNSSLRAAFLVGLSLLLIFPGCARHEFLRISEDSCGGRLEAAWVWFDPPPGCPPVVLVNMVHFGIHDYFEEVQAELDRASVVLIEGIRKPDRAESAPESGPTPDSIDQLDRATAELAFELRLVTQREALVTRPDYMCVDWTADRLEQRVSLDRYLSGLSRLKETVQLIVDQEAERLRRQYPELSYEDLAAFVRRGPLRRQVAERLIQPPIEDPASIRGRNEEVLKTLLGMAPSGLVAICYGADHGPHLARSLECLGYTRQVVTWHRIFGFDREPHPDLIPVP